MFWNWIECGQEKKKESVYRYMRAHTHRHETESRRIKIKNNIENIFVRCVSFFLSARVRVSVVFVDAATHFDAIYPFVWTAYGTQINICILDDCAGDCALFYSTRFPFVLVSSLYNGTVYIGRLANLMSNKIICLLCGLLQFWALFLSTRIANFCRFFVFDLRWALWIVNWSKYYWSNVKYYVL